MSLRRTALFICTGILGQECRAGHADQLNLCCLPFPPSRAMPLPLLPSSPGNHWHPIMVMWLALPFAGQLQVIPPAMAWASGWTSWLTQFNGETTPFLFCFSFPKLPVKLSKGKDLYSKCNTLKTLGYIKEKKKDTKVLPWALGYE